MTIDGIDIRQYGCASLKGTVASMLRFPKRAQVEYNDYAEVDGVEPELSGVAFAPREVRLQLLMASPSPEAFHAHYARLIAVVSAPEYRTVAVGSIACRLRYDTTSTCIYPRPLNAGVNLTAFHLDFLEDAVPPEIPVLPTGGITHRGQYRINGVDFGEFGIGSDAGMEDVLKYPGVKPPFTDGNVTRLSTVRAQHREIKLSLWQLASGEAEFIHNRDALFSQLARPGAQRLYIRGVGETKAYYSDCTAYSMEAWGRGRVAARFTISFVIPVVTWITPGGTNIMRVLLDHGTVKLLADEQGRIIIFK